MKPETYVATAACPKAKGRRLGSACATNLLPLLLLMAPPTVVEAQFGYAFTNQTCTITGYDGPGGAVVIPNQVAGVPVIGIGVEAFLENGRVTSVTIPDGVTSIGDQAFSFCTSMTNIMIPDSVTNVGTQTFSECPSLTAVTVDPLNPAYSSVDGVLFDKTQATLILCPGGKAGSYTIPNSVTSISEWAFDSCVALTNVTIPNSVTGIPAWAFWGSALTTVTIPSSVAAIGSSAFAHCYGLTRVYFQGNAPAIFGGAFGGEPWDLFLDPATIYYLPGTTGWVPWFQGLPIMLWTPQVQTSRSSFGAQTNQFGLTLSWASGMAVVVEASTNLANPTWIPLATNTLTSGSAYFSDPQWTNYPARFYRLRWP